MLKCTFSFIFIVLAFSVQARDYYATSFPLNDQTLSFLIDGEVSELLIQEGDSLTKGQQLIKLDDDEIKIRLEKLRLMEADKSDIKLAELNLKYRENTLEKLTSIAQKNAASKMEVNNAEISRDEASVKLEQARYSRDILAAEVRLFNKQLQRHVITAPGDFRVEKIYHYPGDSVRAFQPLIRVVNLKTLRLDLPVPINWARKLKLGDHLNIEFPDGNVSKAKLVFKANHADAASGQQLISLHYENKSMRPSGEKIKVRIREFFNEKEN